MTKRFRVLAANALNLFWEVYWFHKPQFSSEKVIRLQWLISCWAVERRHRPQFIVKKVFWLHKPEFCAQKFLGWRSFEVMTKRFCILAANALNLFWEVYWLRKPQFSSEKVIRLQLVDFMLRSWKASQASLYCEKGFLAAQARSNAKKLLNCSSLFSCP